MKRVKFQLTFNVSGPAYRTDFRQHIREYEKFQFVEAKVQ